MIFCNQYPLWWRTHAIFQLIRYKVMTLGKLSPSLQTAPLCPQIGTATVSSWSESDHGCYLTPWQQFQSLLVDFIVNKMHQNVIDDRIVLLNSGKYWGIRIACSSCQFLVTAAATAAFSPFPVLNLRFCVNCSMPSHCNILTLPTNIYCSFYKHWIKFFSTKLRNILET